MAEWEDMTVQDLLDMGISLEDFESMLDQGMDPFSAQQNYSSMGILEPPDLGGQQGAWAQYQAYKRAMETFAPPTGHERRLDRSFYMPEPGGFSYDMVVQSNPYLRELLNTAVSSAKPGPNQAFDVEQYVFGKVTDPELEGYEDDDVGKTRIGKAVSQILKTEGEFDYIADQFHSDDRRWATNDRSKQRELLQEWLKAEASGALEGGAPSVSRNLAFSDWAMGRQGGEQMQMGGPGFDRQETFAGGRGRGPRVTLDPRYFSANAPQEAEAMMSVGDFRDAYRGSLAESLGGSLRDMVGQEIADPERGGRWVVTIGGVRPTEVQRQRSANERYNARQARNRRRSDGEERSTGGGGGGRSWWDTSPFNPGNWRPPRGR